MRYLVDTNVLLRWSHADSLDHSVCTQAVEGMLDSGKDLCICAQVLIEFWAVSTRPLSANGLGLTARQIRNQVANLREMFTILPEPPDMADRWQDVADKHSVQGKQAHDARIAALMLAHDLTHILTFNVDDFARYSDIAAVTPQDILHQ